MAAGEVTGVERRDSLERPASRQSGPLSPFWAQKAVEAAEAAAAEAEEEEAEEEAEEGVEGAGTSEEGAEVGEARLRAAVHAALRGELRSEGCEGSEAPLGQRLATLQARLGGLTLTLTLNLTLTLTLALTLSLT